MTNWRPPRQLLLCWLVLLALLSLTVFAAYQPLGAFNTAVALAIALAKSLLVAITFMELCHGRGLTIAVGGSGVFFVGIFFFVRVWGFWTTPPPHN
jgi:cytochrome c oxidase subunit 4